MTDRPEPTQGDTLTVDEVLAITDPGEVDRAQHGPLDRLVIRFGNVVAWAFPLLMIAIVSQVFLRGNGHNQAWLDDAQWWIYGFAMLSAFGYAVTTGSHVRVDIFHEHFSAAKKAKIEVFALGWLLLPFIAMMTDVLFHYAYSSVIAGEGSDSPNGLHRLYLLKMTLPALFTLAGLATYGALKRYLAVISPMTLFHVLVAVLPTVVFVMWRLVEYVFYWFIYFTNADIKARRIIREPIFDYTFWIAAALTAALLVAAFLRHRSKTKG